MRRCVGTVLLVVALLCSLIWQFTVPRLRGGWAVVMSWGIKDLSKRPMDQNYHEHIDIRQLTEQFDGLNLGLNSIFKRITCDLRELHEENAALQRRIGQYEDTEWLHIQLEGQVVRLVGICERITCTIKDLQRKKATLQLALQNQTGIEGLEQCPTDPSEDKKIVWLHTKVMDLFNGLNSIFGRIACTIQELQDGKVAPQNKIGRYEDVEWLYAQVTDQVNGLYRIRKHMVRTIERLQYDNAALQIAVEDIKQSTTDPGKHEDFEWLDTQITDQERGLNMINERISGTIQKLQVAFQNGTKELEQCPKNPRYNEDIEWLHTQVTDQVNKISNLKDTIQKLIVDKVSLQSRIEVLEQGDPSVEMEMRRLREENSTLRGQLATAAKEKLKITWEHDPLHREGIKQLVDGPLVRLDDASAISGDGGGISPQLYRLREVSSHLQNMAIHTSDLGGSLIHVPAAIAPFRVAPPFNAVPSMSRITPFYPTKKITIPCLRARGLVNRGNMCFVNAILQLLVHCPSFWELGVVGELTGQYGAEKSQNSDAGKTPLVNATLRFLGEFVYKKKEHNVVDSFEPTYMYEEMKRKARLKELLDDKQQQDAEDFFYAYLRALDEELDSPILPKFTSMLRSAAPQTGLDLVQDWGWLSLDVLNSSVCTIEDALVLFSQSGLSGSGEASNTKVSIVSLPPVLVLCLNRTVNNTTSPGKVNIIKEAKSIPFSTMLDIPPGIMAATARPLSGPARYKLSGVLYHHGESTRNGHYTVDVRHPDTEGGSSDVWKHIDDETVKVHLDLKDEFPESYRARARDQCSTMLFYHRTSIRTVTTHQKTPDLIDFD